MKTGQLRCVQRLEKRGRHVMALICATLHRICLINFSLQKWYFEKVLYIVLEQLEDKSTIAFYGEAFN